MFLSGTSTDLPEAPDTNEDARRWTDALNAGNLLVYVETARAQMQLQTAFLDDLVNLEVERLNSERGNNETRYQRQTPSLIDIGVKREDLEVSLRRLLGREEALIVGE